MRSRFFHVPIFHTFHHDYEKKVGWLELFYDLIYVAAFIQLGNFFSKNVSFNDFVQCMAIFVPMWITWTGFTYYANRYNVDDIVHRILVFCKMFCVGAMGMSIFSLLQGRPLVFGLAYACAQCMIFLMYWRSWRQQNQGADYAQYWGYTFLISGIVWAVSLFFGPYYYWGWIVGVVIVVAAALTGRAKQLSDRYPFDHEHLSERYGLLTIIVLGESFVKVLSELSTGHMGLMQILQACFALLLTCSIWWIYFDDVANTKLTSGRFSMVTWLYSHLPLQAAIVFLGVGIKNAALFHVGPLAYKYALLLALSLATILIATSIIDSVTLRRNSKLTNTFRVNIRLFSGVMIALLGFISTVLSGTLFLCLCLSICLFQIAFDILIAPTDADERQLMREAMPVANPKYKTNMSHNAFNFEPVLKGVPSSFKKDLFFFLMEASWTQLMMAIALVYLISNLFFAALYLLVPEAINNIHMGGFADAFFFSVQTMSTIGYGVLAPNGLFSNLIVTIEAAFGLIGVAVVTGLIFTKLAKPNSKVLFSEHVLDTIIDQQRTLSFRIGNTRGNDIISAEIKMSALIDHVTNEGEHLRKLVTLTPTRKGTPFFKLTWTVNHILDQNSPLYGMDLYDGKLQAIVVIITGHDGTYSNTIYARHNYLPSDIAQNRYFKDIIHQLPDGRLMVDYDDFHTLKPVGSM
jgi:inward rectifier potassium channel